MSYYTMSIKEVCDLFGRGEKISDQIKSTGYYLFDFLQEWYEPGYDVNNMKSFNDFKELFIMRYYQDEIDFETIQLFKMKLEERLRLKMPYYQELFKTRLKLNDEDFYTLWHELHSNDKGSSENSSNGTSHTDDSGTNKNTHTETGHITDDITKVVDHTSTRNSTDEKSGTYSKNVTTTNDLTDSTNTSSRATTTNNLIDTTTGSVSTQYGKKNNASENVSGTTTVANQVIHSDYPQASVYNKQDYASGMDWSETKTTPGEIKALTSTDSGTDSVTDNTVVKHTGTVQISSSDDGTVKHTGTVKLTESGNDTSNSTITDKETGKDVEDGFNDRELNTTAKDDGIDTHSSDSNMSSSTSGKTIDEHWLTEKGFTGNKGLFLEDLRKAILNMNELIINDCKDLFISLDEPNFNYFYV